MKRSDDKVSKSWFDNLIKQRALNKKGTLWLQVFQVTLDLCNMHSEKLFVCENSFLLIHIAGC